VDYNPNLQKMAKRILQCQYGKKNPNFWTEHVYGMQRAGDNRILLGYLLFIVLCMPRTSVTTASSATACHNKRLKAAMDRLTCWEGGGVEGSDTDGLLSARPWSDSDHRCAIFNSRWAAIRGRGVGVRKRMWHRRMLDGIYFHYRKPLDLRWNHFPL
jgi:hypothetical protein